MYPSLGVSNMFPESLTDHIKLKSYFVFNSTAKRKDANFFLAQMRTSLGQRKKASYNIERSNPETGLRPVKREYKPRSRKRTKKKQSGMIFKKLSRVLKITNPFWWLLMNS